MNIKPGFIIIIFIILPGMIFAQAPGKYFMPSSSGCGDSWDKLSPDLAQKSLEYNKAGLEAVKKGALERAAQLFYCAMSADGYNAGANYNLACAFSLLRTKYGLAACDGTYLAEIEKYLAYAINREPGLRAEMMEDPDFKPIRDFPFFRRLSLNPNSAAADILLRIGTWYGEKSGKAPSSPVVRFMAGNRVSFTYYSRSGSGPNNFDKPIVGTYKITAGNKIEIKLPGQAPLQASLFLRKDKQVVADIAIDMGNFEFLSIDDGSCGTE